MSESKAVDGTLVGFVDFFCKQRRNAFLLVRDPENPSIRVQIIVDKDVATGFRLGDVLLIHSSVSTEKRAPEGLNITAKSVVVLHRPLWFTHFFRQLRFVFWNRMRLDTALKLNH